MTSSVHQIVELVLSHVDDFIRWPTRALLLLPGITRQRYHGYPPAIRDRLRAARIPADTRSNGPAITAYLLAGGMRPPRMGGRFGWSVHHIYDGRFPFPGRSCTAHAVRDGRFFTEAAGLVAIHPVADAIAAEVPQFAWWLRLEAFRRFAFDPDEVFNGQRTGNPAVAHA